MSSDTVPDNPGELAESLPLCAWRSRGNEPCANPTVPGQMICRTHGGALSSPAVRETHTAAAYADIVEALPSAVEALKDVATFSGNDLARVQAAREILDRGGLHLESSILERLERLGSEEVDRLDSIGRLAEKLDTVADRLAMAASPATATLPPIREPGIVEGELED